MRYLLLCFAMVIAGLSTTANGALTFTLHQVGGSTPIAIGSTAEFEVYVSSPVAIEYHFAIVPPIPTPQLVAGPSGGPFTGYTMNVVAGAGNGTAGTFSSGSFAYSVLPDTPQSWDVATTAGHAFSTKSGIGGTLLANSPTLFGTLVLDTSGAQEGVHAMRFSTLAANGFGGAFFQNVGPENSINGAIAGGPINYTITAVPEPTSIATSLGLALAFRIYWRRRRSRLSPSI